MTPEQLIERIEMIRDDLAKGFQLNMNRDYIATCTLDQLNVLLLEAGRQS